MLLDGERGEAGLFLKHQTLLAVDSGFEERMVRRGKGGIVIAGRKLYSLAYADHIVLLAQDEGGLRLMMEELRMYLREKNLDLNVGKSKVMGFGKGGGRESTGSGNGGTGK